MKTITTPNEVLLQKARPVEKVDESVLRIIKQMKDILKKSEIGVGLAAPQVGLSLQLFITSPTLPDRKHKSVVSIQTYINPHILSQSPKEASTDPGKLEGCLSIPDIWGHVARSKTVKLEYQDENGISHIKTFRGFMAVIVQHEVDHLNGILFTHHVLEQGGKLYQPKMNKKGEEVLREVELG